ncbi:MAG TPA: hypothetical protein VMZ31_13445 [Phycisphaerae bacterium]|nr:hypothetical protein [Phycisphaerae bacterium]
MSLWPARNTTCWRLLSLTAWAGMVVSARADEVHRVDGHPPYIGVEIVGFENGELAFRVNTHGNVIKKPLAEIAAISVDNQAAFNQGERLFGKREYAKCVQPFERARRQARRQWLVNLIDMRLLTAYDETGRFDRAVRTFLELLPRAPAEALARRPINIPKAGSEYNRIAFGLISQAEKRIQDAMLLRHVQLLKLDVLWAEQSPAARALAAELDGLAPTSQPSRLLASQIERLSRLVELGRYERALPLIEAAMAQAPADGLDKLLLLQAKCELATAQSDDQLKQAALTAMRVVIHYDRSRWLAEALFVAAEAHERLGLVRQAIALYRDCSDRADAAGGLKAKAGEAINRLRVSATLDQEQETP